MILGCIVAVGIMREIMPMEMQSYFNLIILVYVKPKGSLETSNRCITVLIRASYAIHPIILIRVLLWQVTPLFSEGLTSLI